jgi:hypothetical protein
LRAGSGLPLGLLADGDGEQDQKLKDSVKVRLQMRL